MGKPGASRIKLIGWISASIEAKGSFATRVDGASCFHKMGKFILYQGAVWLQTFYLISYQIAVDDTCKGATI